MHSEQPPIAVEEEMRTAAEQAASLFEQFKDTQVTIYGMTGTLDELVRRCPVPPQQRSFAATEAFTARALERSNIEIPEMFAHLRTETKDTTEHREITPLFTKRSQDQATKSVHAALSFEPRLQATLPTARTHERVTLTPAEFEQSDRLLASALESARLASERLETEAEAETAQQPKLIDQTWTPHTSMSFEPIMPRLTPDALATSIESQPDYAVSQVASETIPPASTSETPVVLTEPELAIAIQRLGELYQSVSTEQAVPGQELIESTITSEIAAILRLDSFHSAESEQDDSEFTHTQTESLSLPRPLLAEIVPELLPAIETESWLTAYIESRPETSSVPALTKLADAMPRPLELRLAATFQELEPAATEHISDLTETMALVSERLAVLINGERGDSEEAAQIEQILETYYDQLCDLVGVTIYADERKQFIAAVRLEHAVPSALAEGDTWIDEGTHEAKQNLMMQFHQLPVLISRTLNVARYMLHHAEQQLA